ncbi:MAG: hemerythrin domain-containing protein [Thiotrichales bacterium]
MIPFEQLSAQNHEIAELTKVLSHLIRDRELCDTDIASKLFNQYVSDVREHFERNSKMIYGGLLTHSEPKVTNTAKRFLEGEKEIKKLFKDFVQRWCRHGLLIKDHARFVAEADDIFRLVAKRIQAEFEELYPIARRVEASTVQRASA